MAKVSSQILDQISELMASCSLCERKCGIDRLAGQKGYCGLGAEAFLFKDFIHWGEEGELSPSHTIYLSGCNLRCSYCDNRAFIDNPETKTAMQPEQLAARIREVHQKGVKNVNWVGGEPSVNLLAIAQTLSQVDNNIPIVWNSNMLATPKVMTIIEPFADVYLADFKFGNDKCAKELGDMKDYLAILTRNLKAIDKKKRLIIRHLPLPGHSTCCSRPILQWLAENLPGVKVSLIGNQVPTTNFPKGLDKDAFTELLQLQRDSGLAEVPLAEMPKEIHDDDDEMMLATNIIINPDGSIIFQDLNGNLVNMAKDIAEMPKEN